VDDAYEKIVQSMFGFLKQMAKMDGEGEDKAISHMSFDGSDAIV